MFLGLSQQDVTHLLNCISGIRAVGHNSAFRLVLLVYVWIGRSTVKDLEVLRNIVYDEC